MYISQYTPIHLYIPITQFFLLFIYCPFPKQRLHCQSKEKKARPMRNSFSCAILKRDP